MADGEQTERIRLLRQMRDHLKRGIDVLGQLRQDPAALVAFIEGIRLVRADLGPDWTSGDPSTTPSPDAPTRD